MHDLIGYLVCLIIGIVNLSEGYTLLTFSWIRTVISHPMQAIMLLLLQMRVGRALDILPAMPVHQT